MGGSDFFCSVSGSRYFDMQEIRDDILEAAEEAEFCQDINEDNEDEDGSSGKHIKNIEGLSEKIKDGLLYSINDEESASNFVLLCPYEKLEGGSIVMHAGFDDPQPSEFSSATIMEVFNIVPGNNPELGDYASKDTEDLNDYCVLGCGNTHIIAYTAYLILKQAAPKLKPYMIYALAHEVKYMSGHVSGVDYGPVGKTMDQYAYWPGIIDTPDGYCSNGEGPAGSLWKDLLTQEGKTDEEILHDAWRGPGNMWAFVRPYQFPIADTLAASDLPVFLTTTHDKLQSHFGVPNLVNLPPDVLLTICEFLPIRTIFALITTCKHFRSQILPHANAIAHRRLLDDEPWLLPAGPFVFKDRNHGREEVDWWADQCIAGGITRTDMKAKFPWLLYRRECSNSMSMWNRKRIWGVAKQIEKLAAEKGLLVD